MYYGQTISPTGRSGIPSEAPLSHGSFMPKGLVIAGERMHGSGSCTTRVATAILPAVKPVDRLESPREAGRRVSSHDRHNPDWTLGGTPS